MWSNLPFDVLSNIFSFLPTDSLARAKLTCRNWRVCATSYSLNSGTVHRHQPPWFLALPLRGRGLSCYVHNPHTDNWHSVSLDFLPEPVRPAASISGLLLLRPTSSMVFQLAICNPFTRQFRCLPMLNRIRTNPALGVVVPGSVWCNSTPRFCVYVAGGMSDGGASYEPTLEVYESFTNKWRILAPMPMEFAVRLTVWAPNESVYVEGSLYWVTSARAYSVMGFEIEGGRWRELSAPFADRLEFAGLIQLNGKLALVGATCGEPACVWQLNEEGVWVLIVKVPVDLGVRLLGGKLSWASMKCVGIDGAVCLYRDIGSGMIVWRETEEKGRREWNWVEGCCSIRGKQVHNFAARGVLFHPNISPSSFP
ncbi:F-box/kelch-repeat protein At5g15710-like [Punica granatum]|uniref:F-box domain-containing protein n=2 Tax=Punica granatum TaxID=22663 RepID=A0A218X1N1_PUNGR|nr:F-box/kelch-repeat protein At5g15710-like [Punica granatum]OWM78252.1 hypothetical protein CDL15_Pgr015071 [Punica granatum]PKI71172.1 hypothetical protein CRG98_008470 [Punica granatum]